MEEWVAVLTSLGSTMVQELHVTVINNDGHNPCYRIETRHTPQTNTESVENTYQCDVVKINGQPVDTLGLQLTKNTDLITIEEESDTVINIKTDEFDSQQDITQKRATVQFDGGAKPNPGKAAIGYIVDGKGDKRHKRSKRIGTSTNNIAEYRALIDALELAIQKEYTQIKAKGDSKLVVNQVKGEWNVNDDTLHNLHKRVQELIGVFDEFSIEHVPRENNDRADSLVGDELDAVTMTEEHE